MGQRDLGIISDFASSAPCTGVTWSKKARCIRKSMQSRWRSPRTMAKSCCHSVLVPPANCWTTSGWTKSTKRSNGSAIHYGWHSALYWQQITESVSGLRITFPRNRKPTCKDNDMAVCYEIQDRLGTILFRASNGFMKRKFSWYVRLGGRKRVKRIEAYEEWPRETLAVFGTRSVVAGPPSFASPAPLPTLRRIERMNRQTTDIFSCTRYRSMRAGGATG